ncbi:MAG: hypothetical protein RML94_14135, partial [Bacteroidia bacterium]|nr:hypothetical protein [Bacteroidia bacterium]
MGQISINNILVHEVNADPRTGAGVVSDLGDIAIATDGSGIYQKIGTSNTDWQLMVGTAQSANQHATNSAVSDVVIQSPSANRILNAIGNNVRCQISSTGVGIGFSTNDQAASALLEMRSTTQGFLPPRMTTAQRQAISSPANGLVVYDTSLNALCRYEENT